MSGTGIVVIPDLWQYLPTLSTLVPFTEISTSSESMLSGQVINLFMTGKIQTQGLIYAGIFTTLIMGFLGAAWVIYCTVQAVVNFTYGFAFTYRDGSFHGNYLGIYELIAILLNEGWAFALTIWSLWFAFDLWAQVEARERGVKTEGSGGEVVDIVEAMKMFTLCVVVGLTAIIGAFSFGDVADQLVTWFDQYADDTHHAEANDWCDGQVEANGTSMEYDITYHATTYLLGYALFSVIAFGGAEFGFYFMKWNDDIQCNFDVADSASVNEVRDLFLNINTVEQCYTILPQVQKKMDFDGDGKVSRCDSAILLKQLGNTDEYAKKYSFRPTWDTTTECNNRFDPLYY